MRINPHRDTFFILINFFTAEISKNHHQSEIREQQQTDKTPYTPKNSSKSHAHPQKHRKLKSDVFTGVYQKPPAQNTRNSRQTKNNPPIQKSPVNKIARIFPRFKIVNVW